MRSPRRLENKAVPVTESPRGIVAFGVFLFFGAIMAMLAAITLLWPGTILDRMWALNSTAYMQLAPLGRAIGIPFLILGAALGFAGTGWFKRRMWGWRLAVLIIAIQVLGDLVNLILGDLVRGAVGVTIAGALLFYLLSPQLRAVFGTKRNSAGN